MNGKAAKKMRRLALKHYNPERVNKKASNQIKNWVRFIKDRYSEGKI